MEHKTSYQSSTNLVSDLKCEYSMSYSINWIFLEYKIIIDINIWLINILIEIMLNYRTDTINRANDSSTLSMSNDDTTVRIKVIQLQDYISISGSLYKSYH